MRKLIFIFVAIFTLCSCSKDETENCYDNSVSPNMFGVFEVSGVLDNSNINKNEAFVLFKNPTEYGNIWWSGSNNYTNDIGEFYAGKLRYQICKYELNKDILTLYVYHKDDNLGYVYKFVFRADALYGGIVLTCLDSEPTKYLRINRNDKIKLTYLGYHIEEWAPKLFRYNYTNAYYIPNGTYNQVNTSQYERMSIIINGNHIKWTCFSYGDYYEEEFYYVLNNNEMIIFKNGKEINRTSWSIDGNLLTLGEIIYMKQ